MTERTAGQEAAIRMIVKFREVAPVGALNYLLGMRALELGVTSLEFPPGDEPRIQDGLVGTQRSQHLDACRNHISNWSPQMRADAERVLGLLARIYPDPVKMTENA